ncbi:MAG: hypothetical protein QOJ60_1203 [Actinomycetota bacterium]|nr:hypothetical protein [Actinomycetota bacterium]
MATSQLLRRALGCAVALLLALALAAPTAVRTSYAATATTSTTQPGPINAANTYGWGPMAWAYDWENGEGLRPWGHWADRTGKVYIEWAMILLDCNTDQFKEPCYGSVRSTLHRTGERYGRWEMRLRAPVWYDGGRDYRVKAELVPAAADKYACGAHNIALASFLAGGNHVNVYARNAHNQWTFTKQRMVLDRTSWHTYAVEVTRHRISWFIDAHVVSTVRNDRAISGLRLTPRLSLQGVSGAAMDRVRIGVDWVRHFTLARPNTKSVDATAPVATAYHGC